MRGGDHDLLHHADRDYWSGSKRSKYLGLQTLVAALSATVFLGIGGLLGASGWRTPFWLYLLAVVLVIPMAKLLWQPARPPRTGVKAKLEPVGFEYRGLTAARKRQDSENRQRHTSCRPP